MVSLHKEPCLKSSLMGFPWVLDPFCSQSSQNGVPIVQLMFLYEARALRTGTSAAQLGPHFWPLSVKVERTGSSNLKNSSNKGWVGKRAAARPANAAGPKLKLLTDTKLRIMKGEPRGVV